MKSLEVAEKSSSMPKIQLNEDRYFMEVQIKLRLVDFSLVNLNIRKLDLHHFTKITQNSISDPISSNFATRN